jgi:hypothetical protein
MDAEAERQRGLELGRRWAEHASAHELATMVSGSFDDLSQMLPADVSDHSSTAFAKACCTSGAGPRRPSAQHSFYGVRPPLLGPQSLPSARTIFAKLSS